MKIYYPKTPLEAVQIRKENDNTVYLAGGTDDLRLGGNAVGKDLIDITGLVPKSIECKGNLLYIGSGITLQQLIEAPEIPAFIKEAASFCSSYVKRCSATIGGNIGLRRKDSYLAAALLVADAKLYRVTPHGEDEKEIGEYLKSQCKSFIQYIIIDKNVEGSVKRIGNTSASHATLIAAKSENRYALSVYDTVIAYGNDLSFIDHIAFKDDMTGSAEYKKYLAKVLFE